jgi:transketolase
MGHHGTPVSKNQLEAVLSELDKRAAELGIANLDATASEEVFRIAPPLPAPAAKAAGQPAGFMAEIAKDPKLSEAVTGKKALSPRRAYGLALKALGAADPSVVALDADVKNSTYALEFATAYPDRYFEARIAEQNMISAAAGLSSGRKIPFVSTFGRFLERGFDQIEMAIIGGANIKLVGTHVGVTLASDGPSQMALADVAFMRAFAHVQDSRGNPAATVLTPSDAVSTYKLVLAMAAFPSACYLRAVRADLPILYDESETFPFGGHKVLRKAGDGSGRVVLVGSGYLVHSCLKAAEALAAEGIIVAVVDAYSLPMDASSVLALAGPGGAVVTVEDNYVGGIGSELAEAAAAMPGGAPRVRALTVRNIPKSGRTADDVLAYVHLSVDEIVRAVTAA